MPNSSNLYPTTRRGKILLHAKVRVRKNQPRSSMNAQLVSGITRAARMGDIGLIAVNKAKKVGNLCSNLLKVTTSARRKSKDRVQPSKKK